MSKPLAWLPLNASLPPSPYIIGEVAQAHDGSLGFAHAFIDIISSTGANAVKFQTHIADAESSPGEPWRVKFSKQDASRFDYWKRMEFKKDQWAELKKHAEDVGLDFISSPFSVEALELLESIGITQWKMASGEINNEPLLKQILNTKKPIIFSSGMSSLDELDRAIELTRKSQVPFAILQCTSQYPTPAEKLGLNLLSELAQRYQCPVGLSDHSGNIYSGLGAVALGAKILEVHITMHKKAFGPDVIASISDHELKQLVEGAAFLHRAITHPVEKDSMAVDLQELRRLFTKSIVVRAALQEGEELRLENLSFKKPGTGIPAAEYEKVLGKRTRRSLAAGAFLSYEDLV